MKSKLIWNIMKKKLHITWHKGYVFLKAVLKLLE